MAPAIFGMWDRAPQGAAMIDNFAPYMTDARLDDYERDIAKIDAAVREGNAPRFADSSPQFEAFSVRWQRTIDPDMSELVTTIRGNVGNYDAVAALPRFTLFPWFFVIPGVLLVLLAGAALARPGWWRGIRVALVLLGVGLVVAPAVFQMWDRAPKGGRMVDAFRPIETRTKVQTIQRYFGDIVVGQGAVRLELIAGLERSGMSRAEIARRYPALVAFERDWPEILGDFTPLIATMSDNVGNYDAVKALPPFPLFPWFFLVPGLLVVGLSLVPSIRTPRSDHMTRTSRRAAVAGVAMLVAAAVVAAPAGAAKAKPQKLVGTFKLDPGKFAGGTASGTYFRMIFADGKQFFSNPDSEATDKTYTLLKPGKKGGLITGKYQPNPATAFDDAGNATANAIVLPQKFAGILFSIATLNKDPQSNKKAALPSITATGTRLTGDTSAWTAEWNKLFFNQGSPKPGGGTGNGTTAVTGNYSPKTKKFILRWRSKIQGGAFDGFIGFWHLQGTFQPA